VEKGGDAYEKSHRKMRETENVSSAIEESGMYVMLIVILGVLLVTSIKMPVFSLNFGLLFTLKIIFLSHNY
jgi:hypothetical protein